MFSLLITKEVGNISRLAERCIEGISYSKMIVVGFNCPACEPGLVLKRRKRI